MPGSKPWCLATSDNKVLFAITMMISVNHTHLRTLSNIFVSWEFVLKNVIFIPGLPLKVIRPFFTETQCHIIKITTLCIKTVGT